jgi:hypothetical protein
MIFRASEQGLSLLRYRQDKPAPSKQPLPPMHSTEGNRRVHPAESVQLELFACTKVPKQHLRRPNQPFFYPLIKLKILLEVAVNFLQANIHKFP